MTAADSPRPCLICEQESADDSVTVFRDEEWAAGIVPGYEVPGWIVLRIRRHAEHIDSLSDAELATLGRRARDLVAAVRGATGAEAVYYMVFGEANPHYHALITPRGADIPPAERTGAILPRRLDHADLGAATALVPAIRSAYRRLADDGEKR
jgi:diadenosine tetraphosphate (Ap4A) HIT family hydrolase